jgi:hypothetical protein
MAGLTMGYQAVDLFPKVSQQIVRVTVTGTKGPERQRDQQGV